MYFQKYHFNIYEFGIIGKLILNLLLENAKISILSKVDKMYLLLYWVTFCVHYISHTRILNKIPWFDFQKENRLKEKFNIIYTYRLGWPDHDIDNAVVTNSCKKNRKYICNSQWGQNYEITLLPIIQLANINHWL